MSTQYFIRPWPQPEEIWALVKENSETSRKSVDGSHVVLKFDGPTPPQLAGDTLMSHTEALALMNTSEWKHPEPEESE